VNQYVRNKRERRETKRERKEGFKVKGSIRDQ
jgi:hypothetical protein